MSRREDHRSSDSKRHRSRYDREPSPKRSRRDDKRETERQSTKAELNKEHSDRDHKYSCQDPLHLKTPSTQDAKIETKSISKASENNDRGSNGQNGKSSGGKTNNARGWWRDPKEHLNDPRKDDKAKDNKQDNHVWHHNGHIKTETNSNPPIRKRPSFREQKLTQEGDKGAKDTPKAENPVFESRKRTERGQISRHSEKPEHEVWGYNRPSGNSRYRGNESFNGRQGYNRPSGGRVEKWKHDLYDEANKSANPKNEEEQIAKIEALLSS